MSESIRIAIVGVGNCASSLLQALSMYGDRETLEPTPVGLISERIGGLLASQIVPVAAFDVDDRKVGASLAEAAMSKPNCTPRFAQPAGSDVVVLRGPRLDGVATHMNGADDPRPGTPQFHVTDESDVVDVAEELQRTGVDVVVNYLPVGSRLAARHYADAAIDAGVSFVNAMPTFLASDPQIARRFAERGQVIVGDDVKSQFGATFAHRLLVQGMQDRGVSIRRTKQENYGGNSDFLNMSDPDRLQDKLTSKSRSIESRLTEPLHEPLYAGPGDGPGNGHGYVEGLDDLKRAIITVDGVGLGGMPITVRCELECYDSPNSAGVIIDAIRATYVARRSGRLGAVEEASAFLFKHPPTDVDDAIARDMLHAIAEGP